MSGAAPRDPGAGSVPAHLRGRIRVDPDRRCGCSQQILDAVTTTFAAGYHEAPYNQILEDVGVSEGASCHRFDDEEDLSLKVLEPLRATGDPWAHAGGWPTGWICSSGARCLSGAWCGGAGPPRDRRDSGGTRYHSTSLG